MHSLRNDVRCGEEPEVKRGRILCRALTGAILCGWLMHKKYSSEELYGDSPTIWYTAWRILLRYFAPLALIGVFVDMFLQAI